MPAEGVGSPNQRKGRLPVEVGAVLTDCRRKNDTTEEITWFFFDVDSGGATWERLHKTLSDLGVAHLVCDSSTHGVNKDTGEADPSAVRWHAYIALDPPIAVPAQGRKGYPERVWHPQYAHVRAALQTLAGVSSADKSVDDLAQSAYVARIPPGGEVRRVKWSNGRGLRWDALLDALDYEAPEERSKGGTGAANPAGSSNTANANDRAGLGPKIWRSVQSLKAQGVDLKPTPADGGKVHIVCPWAHEHTTGSNRFGEVSSETSIWIGEADGGFKCQHSHCAGRNVKDFLRWVAKHGILSEDIEERPPSEPAGALLSMNATLRALDNLGLLRELEDTDGLPDKWGGDSHAAPLFLADEWTPTSLSSSWRMTWAGGDPAPRHTLLETGGIVPTSGVIACARGISLLRGDAPISRAVFVRDPADLAVLVALRGKMSDARKDWDDADNVEEMPVFCGDPGILQIMLKPRLAYACTLVLCGYTDRSVERVAASCDLWTLRSPARALRDNGLESGLHAARKISRLGKAPITLLKPLDPVAWHPTDENGLAQRFRDGFYDRVRVVKESGEWRVYTPMGSAGYAWRDDTHAAVGGMAQQIFEYSIPEEIKRVSEPDKARIMESWRRRMMARGYNKMLSDAKERDGDGRTLTVPTEAFDKREETKYILNTEGGMLDISGTQPALHSPTPEKYITKIMRVTYTSVNPGCPLWKRSLEQWLRVEQDGPPNYDLITYMQALCGYLLTGDVSAEKMWVFAGEGANGKSTFCNVIRRILGDYAIQIDPAILMDHGTDKGSPTAMSRKAVLQGVRIAFASETGSGERLSSALVKQLASDEPIQAKHMCKNPFTFHPTHKLIMLTNHEPATDDTGHGAMRRLVIIRWPHRVADADRVDGLADKLFNEEAAGILHWMLEGVKLWRAGMLKDANEPECIRVKRDKYRKDHDWFGNFFEDCLVKANTGFVSGSMVNALFHAWFYSKEGAAPKSAGAARKELRKAGYNEVKKYEAVGGQKKQVCGFECIKPNEASEHYLKALEACARMRGE